MNHWKIYEYAKCSTCKKALTFLEHHGIHYSKLPIVEQPPTETELKKMLRFLGGNLKKLFNTSGIQYRELGMSKKLETLSEADAISLLSKNGKLVKRPFLLGENSGTVGFNESEWKKLIK